MIGTGCHYRHYRTGAGLIGQRLRQQTCHRRGFGKAVVAHCRCGSRWCRKAAGIESAPNQWYGAD